MKHFAVTITRTCGAGGTSIAKILSAHYGIEYYDRMLLRLAAGNSGINEAVFAAADEDTKKSHCLTPLRRSITASISFRKKANMRQVMTCLPIRQRL